MKPQDLLNSFDRQELLGIAEALPKVLADRGIELPATVGSTAVTTELDQAPTIPTWEQSLTVLPAERRSEFVADREALAKEYKRPESDFSLITTSREVDGEVKDFATVVLGTTKGIDLGDPRKIFDKKRNWNNIDPTKPNEQFMVKVNGQEVDTREGLTLEVMRELTARNPEINEWVWETGRPELAGDHSAPIVRARGGVASRGFRSRGVGHRVFVAFRPAVEREI